MNPATAPGASFFVPVAARSVNAPCHTYTERRHWVPIGVWNGTAFGRDRDFLLDTGADFCTVDYGFALAHNFQLDDHCRISVGGLTGSSPAWLTRRYLRFRQLPNVRFSFHFLVPVPRSHPSHPAHDPNAPTPNHPPLLGVADLLSAFQLALTASGCRFELLAGAGTPIP
jgi:hypothetical protein